MRRYVRGEVNPGFILQKDFLKHPLIPVWSAAAVVSGRIVIETPHTTLDP